MSEAAPGFKDNSRRRFLKGLTATPVAALAAGDGLLAQVAKKAHSEGTTLREAVLTLGLLSADVQSSTAPRE